MSIPSSGASSGIFTHSSNFLSQLNQWLRKSHFWEIGKNYFDIWVGRGFHTAWTPGGRFGFGATDANVVAMGCGAVGL